MQWVFESAIADIYGYLLVGGQDGADSAFAIVASPDKTVFFSLEK